VSLAYPSDAREQRAAERRAARVAEAERLAAEAVAKAIEETARQAEERRQAAEAARQARALEAER
jgi:UDP-N-acetylglucosamine:LPS N-acetylglucosamine transferase